MMPDDFRQTWMRLFPAVSCPYRVLICRLSPATFDTSFTLIIYCAFGLATSHTLTFSPYPQHQPFMMHLAPQWLSFP